MTSSLEPELRERLRQIYGLNESPITAQDFFKLLRDTSRRSLGVQAFMERVKAGEVVIGQCNHETKYSLNFRGKSVHVACAYDALMTALLRGNGDIAAMCPHCDDKMRIRIREGHVTDSYPSSTLFWWGAGTLDAPGNPICDHIHLFPSRQHLAEWLQSHTDELGFALSLEEARALLTDRS